MVQPRAFNFSTNSAGKSGTSDGSKRPTFSPLAGFAGALGAFAAVVTSPGRAGLEVLDACPSPFAWIGITMIMQNNTAGATLLFTNRTIPETRCSRFKEKKHRPVLSQIVPSLFLSGDSDQLYCSLRHFRVRIFLGHISRWNRWCDSFAVSAAPLKTIYFLFICFVRGTFQHMRWQEPCS
jgi:hypothetical protein